METWMWIVLAAVAVALLAGIGSALMRERHRTRLRETFGPEYERTVGEAGDVRHGESELQARRRRRASIEVRPLTTAARSRYERAWVGTQGRFVDDPAAALAEADELIRAAMRERGYPVEDFEQRAADLSVDHPDVVQHYRAAFRISSRAGEGGASTEEMRQAIVHYRALFAELTELDRGRSKQAR
jgi:hypothetical protein